MLDILDCKWLDDPWLSEKLRSSPQISAIP